MFDPNNIVVKLCAQGMEMESRQEPGKARELFQQAWEQAKTDLEKSTAAHYLARQQLSLEDKLSWDMIALEFALKIDNEEIKANFPSLYLNIGKCHEDLNDPILAREFYQKANSFAEYLPSNGYGTMIRHGIENGLQRTSA